MTLDSISFRTFKNAKHAIHGDIQNAIIVLKLYVLSVMSKGGNGFANGYALD